MGFTIDEGGGGGGTGDVTTAQLNSAITRSGSSFDTLAEVQAIGSRIIGSVWYVENDPAPSNNGRYVERLTLGLTQEEDDTPGIGIPDVISTGDDRYEQLGDPRVRRFDYFQFGDDFLIPDYPTRSTLILDASSQPDGSAKIQTDEFAHPSIVSFDRPWNGYKEWMCITPYPNGNATFENPSIAVRSGSDSEWMQHPTVNNPVAPYPAGSNSQGDVHLYYDEPSKKLFIHYLRTDATSYEIRRIESEDGVTWSPPTIVISETYAIGSPSVIFHQSSNRYRLYVSTAESGTVRLAYYASQDLVTTNWGLPTECGELNMPAGHTVWDGHTYEYNGQIARLASLATSNTGSDAKLCLAVSPDSGDSFDYRDYFIMVPDVGSNVWPNSLIYTSDMRPVIVDGQSRISLTVTGRRSDGTWGLGNVISRFSKDIENPETSFYLTPDFLQTVDGSNVITASQAVTRFSQLLSADNLSGTPQVVSGNFVFNRAESDWVGFTSGTPIAGLTDFSAVVRFRISANPPAGQRQTILLAGNLVIQIRGHASLGTLLGIGYSNGASVITIAEPAVVELGEFLTVCVSIESGLASIATSKGLFQTGLAPITASDRIFLGGGDGFFTGEVSSLRLFETPLDIPQIKNCTLVHK